MPEPPVLFDLDEDGVATITLNRPEKLNACSGELLEGLTDAYRRCDGDDAVRAVVVTGAGRAFCAGADMSDAARTFDVSGPGALDDFSAAAIGLPAFRVRKLVVAAVNGHAIGLGLSLALQCDVRIFAREGRYGIVQVRRGVIGDAYSHWTLARLVGVARAAEMMLTGRTFEGPELEGTGLASRLVPADAVLDVAREIARDTAIHAAPLSVAISKRILWGATERGPESTLRLETEMHRVLMPHADAVEGPVAHAEGRAPRFRGRVTRDWPEWPED